MPPRDYQHLQRGQGRQQAPREISESSVNGTQRRLDAQAKGEKFNEPIQNCTKQKE